MEAAAAGIESKVQEVTVKTKSKAKTKAKIKSKKSPCKHCEKLYVYTDKHEKNCKKNPEVTPSQKSKSIAIKA